MRNRTTKKPELTPELAIQKHQYLWVLEREVARQCRSALIAAEDLACALRKPDHDRVWYALQGLLIAAGNVSKLLWPSRERIPCRGELLRQILGVPDDSPLASRDFRDHFEHFDERLEDWILTSTRHGLVDANIGPPEVITWVDPQDRHRHFDPTTWTAYFRGTPYKLQPVVEALRELNPRAAALADTHEELWRAIRAGSIRVTLPGPDPPTLTPAPPG